MEMTVTFNNKGWEMYYDENNQVHYKEPPQDKTVTEIHGNKVYYDEDDDETKYVASNQPAERPCKRCGEYSTRQDHDYCLGNLGEKVISACCGHGAEQGFIMFRDGRIFREENPHQKTEEKNEDE